MAEKNWRDNTLVGGDTISDADVVEFLGLVERYEDGVLVDADGDTKIQVEESADEDIIRFDTGGTQRMTIDATGTVSVSKSATAATTAAVTTSHTIQTEASSTYPKALENTITYTGTGTQGWMAALNNAVVVNSEAGVVTNAIGTTSKITLTNGALTTGQNVYFQKPTVADGKTITRFQQLAIEGGKTGTGTITNFQAIRIYESNAGTNSYAILVDGGTCVFNDAGGDYDFRIEGDTDSSLFCVDASADKIGIGTNAPAASKLDINDSSIRVRTAKTPSTANDTGTTGQICWDSSYIYVCVDTDTWKRIGIATWP
jgi:hypothetical protein